MKLTWLELLFFPLHFLSLKKITNVDVTLRAHLETGDKYMREEKRHNFFVK